MTVKLSEISYNASEISKDLKNPGFIKENLKNIWIQMPAKLFWICVIFALICVGGYIMIQLIKILVDFFVTDIGGLLYWFCCDKIVKATKIKQT